MTIPMSEKIVFIEASLENDEFSYDFEPLAQEVRELRERVKTATTTSFDYISAFFSALRDTSYQVLYNIVPSFTYSVLGVGEEIGNQHIPATIEVLFFRTIVWAGALTFSAALQVYNRFAQNLGWTSQDNQATLDTYSKTLDSRHFRTKELTLDTSGVPATVSVDSLLGMFDRINFNKQTRPGYMAPASRQEGSTTYTVADLKIHLTKFVDHVRSRTPFLGTPPAHDTLALMKFYQQIEDAVRLSIHKSNEDLKAFQGRCGTDTAAYSPTDLNAYKNILEDRSRLVIDLAIAGANCGARFMGDSMSVYGNFYGGSQNQDTLEDNLIEILAHKRKEIVEGMVQEGQRVVDTHRYAEHMSLLGEILGLPGTNGVVEHLSNHLNRSERLRTFFKCYTEDVIIETINKKWQDVKAGGAFRTQIYDWIGALMGDWNKGKYADFLASEEIQTFQTQLESLKITESDVSNEMEQLSLLTSLITNLRPHLTEETLQNLTVDNWDAFLTDILAPQTNENDSTFQAKQTFRQGIGSTLNIDNAQISEALSKYTPEPALQKWIKTEQDAGKTTSDDQIQEKRNELIQNRKKQLILAESLKIISSMKATFSKNTLGNDLVSSLISFASGETTEINKTPFIEIFSKPKKHDEVLRLFKSLEDDQTSAAVSEAKRALSSAHIEEDSVLRFLDGSLLVEELLANTYEKVRRNEFIEKFQVYGDQINHARDRYQDLMRRENVQKIENEQPVTDENGPVYEEKISYEPLPPALIEALLVSHHIFLPQSITKGGI